MTCTYCEQQFDAKDLKAGYCPDCRIEPVKIHGITMLKHDDGLFSSLEQAENYRQRKVGF